MSLHKEFYSSNDPDKPRLPEQVVTYERNEKRATIMEGAYGSAVDDMDVVEPESTTKGKNKKLNTFRFSRIRPLSTSLPRPESPLTSPFSAPKDFRLPQIPRFSTQSSNNISGEEQTNTSDSTHPKARARRKYTSVLIPGSVATERRRAGWDPGIDIKSTDVILNSVGSAIMICDYDSTKYEIVKAEVNSGDENSKELTRMLKGRPEWSKVRWVNVNGLSWEAISVIAEYYQLHRLAVEDMVDIPQRTKVDKYPDHTLFCFPLLKLIHRPPRKPRRTDRIFQTEIYEPTETFTMVGTDQSKALPAHGPSSVPHKLSKLNMNTIYQWTSPQEKENRRTIFLETRRPLAKMNRVVGVEQVSLFITDDNTIISFFEKSGADIENPLLSRIGNDSTLLRESCDPSILFQGIIDTCVDLLYPIITAYRERLDELQIDAIISPSMAHTRQLHLVNSDLTLLRNLIVPITVSINSLREHATDYSKQYMPPPSGYTDYKVNSNFFKTSNHKTPPEKNANSQISDLGVIYLSDVVDHTMTYTQDLDVMQSNVKSMIDLVFNTISIQSADAVRLLSLVTVIFLPLSFLTGYFGMNFKQFDILDHSDGYYWGIALPFAIVLVLLLMWRWVLEKWRSVVNVVRKYVETRKRRLKKEEIMRKKASIMSREIKDFA